METQRADLGFKHSYDYIIVGAGSAGCIVASSLSEKCPRKSILLIEAGPDIPENHENVWDPTRWYHVIRDDNLSWGYQSTKQENLDDRDFRMDTSKAMGGCSIHNGMVYVRGGKKGFDDWQKLGNEGWDYASIEKYFKQVEAVLPLMTEMTHDFMESLKTACKCLGINYVPNYNETPDLEGISPLQFAVTQTKEGYYRRATTQSAFLKIQPDSLTIKTCWTVEKIKLNPSSITAESVILTPHPPYSPIEIFANEEIILFAGAIGSPKLLMLSGIGPKDQLESKGITCLVDLPGVGENLQDDVMVVVEVTNRKNTYPRSNLR